MANGLPIREITAESPLDVHQTGATVHLSGLNQQKILARLTQLVNPFTDFRDTERKAYRWRKVRPLSGGSYTNTDDLVEGLNAADEPPTWPAFCADPNADVVADSSVGDVVWLYPGDRDDREDPELNYGLEWWFIAARTLGAPNCRCPGVYTQCEPTSFIPKRLIMRYKNATIYSDRINRDVLLVYDEANPSLMRWNGTYFNRSYYPAPPICSGGDWSIRFQCSGAFGGGLNITNSVAVCGTFLSPPFHEIVSFGWPILQIGPPLILGTTPPATHNPFHWQYTSGIFTNRPDAYGGIPPPFQIGTVEVEIMGEMGMGAAGFPPGQVVIGDPAGSGGTSTLSTTRLRSDGTDLLLQFQISADRWLEYQKGSY